MKKPIAQVVVGLPVEGPFDYAIPEQFQKNTAVGSRVLILFNRTRRIGYVTALKQRSRFKKLNSIMEVLDPKAPSLDARAVSLTKTFRDYYGCSWGEAIETYFPKALREKSVVLLKKLAGKNTKNEGKKVLLHDYGLQKRWSYIRESAGACLKQEKSVIFLVPEKSYAKTAVRHLQEFQQYIMVLETKVSKKAEIERWVQLKEEGPFIVVGTRSAVFSPLKQLGLIVIYEEENPSYKQDQSPHYHVNDVALMRAKLEGVGILISSSCPSAEIVHAAKSKSWQTLTLEDELPPVQLIDMKNYNPKQTSRLSYPLQNQLQETFKSRGRTILFMNRRGFSTLTRCNQCGHTMRCPHCDAVLTYMFTSKKLKCRHCTFTVELPKICPQCRGSYMRSMGLGIEKLESEMARFYPEAKIVHYDKESAGFPKGADVILATQALMKNRETLKADLSAILSFDAVLNHADFRSGQRAFSTTLQLAQMTKGRLVVQSRNLKNYCLDAIKKWDFKKFYQEELKLRKELAYPPYSHLLLVLIRGKKEDDTFKQAQKLYEIIKGKSPKGIEAGEPNQDFMPKLRDQYRYTIMLKSKKVKPMLKAAKEALAQLKKRGVVITLNIDP